MPEPEKQVDRVRRLIKYLLRCYPECAVEESEDYKDFIEDVVDIVIAERISKD